MPPGMTGIITGISICLMCLGLLIALLNLQIWYQIIQNEKRGIKKTISFIPILSILFSAAAYYVGRPVLGYWPLLPALVDPFTLMILGLPWFLLTKFRKHVNRRPPAE